MNNDIEKLYKELYGWLIQPYSCVPDVEIGAIFDWIDGKLHQKGKNKPSLDAVNELAILRKAVYNPHSGCPDVEIGFVVDWMRSRIAHYLHIEDELDKAILTELWFHDLTKKALVGYIIYTSDYSEVDIEAYIDLLIESEKISDNNGTIQINRKAPLR